MWWSLGQGNLRLQGNNKFQLDEREKQQVRVPKIAVTIARTRSHQGELGIEEKAKKA
jgi:hypothetical protein